MFSVYPCVYREHLAKFFCVRFSAGLSLCIQGTPSETTPSIRPERFIPVYTGNTSALYSATSTTGGLSLCIQGTQ